MVNNLNSNPNNPDLIYGRVRWGSTGAHVYTVKSQIKVYPDIVGHGHSQHNISWYLRVSAQSFLTVKVSVRSSAEKTPGLRGAGEQCVPAIAARVCSPARQQWGRGLLGVPQTPQENAWSAQPSNCLTYTHPNSSNSYLILSSFEYYYPLPCMLCLFSRVSLCAS